MKILILVSAALVISFAVGVIVGWLDASRYLRKQQAERDADEILDTYERQCRASPLPGGPHFHWDTRKLEFVADA
jgi:hypothetical protein